MPKEHLDDDLSDDEAVDFQEDAESRRKRLALEAKEAEDSDDDDDFDLLGEDDAEEVDNEADSDDEDDDESSDDEDDSDDDEADEKPARRSATDVPKVGRKKQTAEERIAELAEKRREAEAAAFNAELRASELEKRIEALEKNPPAQRAATQIPPEPKPDDFKYGEVDPAYVEAMVNHRVAKKLAETQESSQEESREAQIREVRAKYEARLASIMAEGPTKYSDFETKVKSVQFDGRLARMILDSDRGVDISYFLANNISKLRELTAMDDTKRAIAIGRLEERFSARASAGKKRSKAPDMPGRGKNKRRISADEAKYGPRDQDAFDKAYNGVS